MRNLAESLRPTRLAAGLVALLIGAAPALDAQAAPAPSAPRTQVVMLGTGTPNADPERSGPAVAVVRDGKAYLVDAGPGVVRRAALAARTAVPALAPPNMRIVFLTHLHSDHTAGLPDLWLTPWVLERAVPFVVYGPPGTKAMMEHLQAAYQADIRNRLDGLEPANDSGWRVIVHEVAPGRIFSDGNVTVTAIAVPHGDWERSFAYRFDSDDRAIVISGDVRPSEALMDACNGCDVLVHEVYSADRFVTRPPEWQRYHARAHTSTTELAAPKLLVMYHQLYWGTDDEGLMAELRRAGYARPAVSARDLGIY
jgi:ribonuclease BN (tRNA processing enzyme)